MKKESEKVKTQEERKEFIKKFRERYKDDVVAKFLEEVDKYCRVGVNNGYHDFFR